MQPSVPRLFLLSPANCGGPRGRLLLTSTGFDLARRLDSPEGVPIGDVFSFISGLYFRGKLAYVRAFAPGSAYVITPSRGLLHPDTPVTRAVLEEFAGVPIDAADPRYREPLVRDLLALACDPACEVVLLGSVASPKYIEPLMTHLGARLLFPSTFVGRGDMSRGGVMLRAVTARVELEYQPVAGAVLRGRRPAKLEPIGR